ncbi:uncharacterized protein L969DRAFT_87153 [Mixia osmundae IAM 14324]|uniref:uncharacterized protein n=1 Tax=Mixia osmundae (strain CBS 9802 / IAM 14324 / JCM 22182 / KY 12970) TaxID=764103 RepID=UPI0004A55941|nr:uncharacterized protein L969DRAFT_87153 [Mixia osmundae IAM 14324]KEI39214.1 hypothetical protein L969DRAFT_87153 [Mixia osmundae IAM 14324]
MRQWSFISFVAACTVTALAKPSWPKVDTGALAQRNSLLERGDQALADSPIEERSVLTNIYDVKMDMYGMCAETGGVIGRPFPAVEGRADHRKESSHDDQGTPWHATADNPLDDVTQTELHVFIQSKIADAVAVSCLHIHKMHWMTADRQGQCNANDESDRL